jgi:hypothetical protein
MQLSFATCTSVWQQAAALAVAQHFHVLIRSLLTLLLLLLLLLPSLRSDLTPTTGRDT